MLFRSLGYTLDGINIPETVAPHKTRTWKEKILWNNNPDVSNLNPDAAKPFTDGKILTDYAMPEVGNYFVKFCAMIEVNGQMTVFESEPVKIVVALPKDADIGVWKKIEESGEIGYFIQKSDFPRARYYGPEEQNELISKIQKLIEENPTGVYAKTLR